MSDPASTPSRPPSTTLRRTPSWAPSGPAVAARASTILLALLIVAAPLLAQELPSTRPERVGMSSDRLDELTEELQEYVSQDRLPGMATIVLRDGRVVYHEALGRRDRESSDPMTTDAIFRIASQTKAIVSVGIMILQEEGELLISDRLSKYIPEFADVTVAEPRDGGGYEVVEAERPITLRHLLTHTAGVGYGSGTGGEQWSEAGITGWYFGHRTEPIQETVKRMAALPLPSQPGEAWVYGYSTDILGAVIEIASGMPLDQFLRSRIFEPLKMVDTHFYLPRDKRGRLATVYNLPEDGDLSRAPDGPGMQTQGQYAEGPKRSFSGGAGLLSTTRDYARFLQMLLNGGELEGARILSPKTVALMTSDHVGELYGGEGMGFGLGFRIRLDLGASGLPGSVGDFGWGGAYHSTYWVDPVENLVVVYLTQVIPASGLDDQDKLRALVYSAVTESYAEN